jgi:hypothetical protein
MKKWFLALASAVAACDASAPTEATPDLVRLSTPMASDESVPVSCAACRERSNRSVVTKSASFSCR